MRVSKNKLEYLKKKGTRPPKDPAPAPKAEKPVTVARDTPEIERLVKDIRDGSEASRSVQDQVRLLTEVLSKLAADGTTKRKAVPYKFRIERDSDGRMIEIIAEPIAIN